LLAQAYMAWWFASHTPGAVWRTLLGVLLALAAPSAGAVAFLRRDRIYESQAERISRVEYAVAVVGLSLIVPTFVMIALSGGIF
jgi:hypothetical protein